MEALQSRSAATSAVIFELYAVNRRLELLLAALILANQCQEAQSFGYREAVKTVSSAPSVGASQPVNDDKAELSPGPI